MLLPVERQLSKQGLLGIPKHRRRLLLCKEMVTSKFDIKWNAVWEWFEVKQSVG